MECRGRHGCSCPYGRTRRLEPKVIDEFRANDGKVRVRGAAAPAHTHTGARTGETYLNLAYFTYDDRYVIVASKGGAPTNPDWYHNLREPVRDGGGRERDLRRHGEESGRARAPVGDDHREEPVLRRVRALDPPDDPGDDPAPDRGLASGQLVEPAAHQSCEVGGVRQPVRLGDDGGSFPVEAPMSRAAPGIASRSIGTKVDRIAASRSVEITLSSFS